MPIGKPTVRVPGETTPIICPECDGTKRDSQTENNSAVPCPTCKGTGTVQAKVVNQKGPAR